jgi:hypothetical protein
MANCLPPAVALPVGAFRLTPLTFRATSQLWETKRETGKDVVIGFHKGEGRAVQTTRAGDGGLFIYV